MRFFEEYRCGCLSKLSTKRDLQRYCAKHGDNWINLYRADGVRVAINIVQKEGTAEVALKKYRGVRDGYGEYSADAALGKREPK